MLKISRNSLLYKKKDTCKVNKLELEKRIVHLFRKHKGDYGRVRLKKALAKENIHTSEYTIAKILKKYNLQSKRGIRKKYSRKKTEQEILEENKILDLDTNNLQKNYLWVSDITEFKCKYGRTIYLTSILDVATRSILGYHISTHKRQEVVKYSLEQAFAFTQTVPKIFHSDRGSQYTAKDIHKILREKHVEISMSRPGTPSDNPFIESLWKTIKLEIDSLSDFNTKEAMREIVKELNYYNHDRMHSSIDYKSPMEKYQEDWELEVVK